ncbi:MAG: hypothetical protein ACLTLQ_09585 [[Clostridium] scindens]
MRDGGQSPNGSSRYSSEIIRTKRRDCCIGTSFFRGTHARTPKAPQSSQQNRKHKVSLLLTDGGVHLLPSLLYSSCNLIARSDMASIVDSLGCSHRGVVNALVVALCMKKQKEVISTLETLEQIWDEYQVYSKDELNMVNDKVELSVPGEQEDEEDE